ncbi:mediator of RNA polymerase II transcription subunit 15a-like isoform X4 [Zingiber officinale]|uniref:mediator of RNA polymerase II transcription subunit 15a-like isoform X4 n=1 Tax=Zingiber officinale TaxID=94328 RepID=UPI001C4BF348|nr:mediator of RNA polymerase II transcription subunit 15a-like isoform X4 [Zingiber officinale]
MEGNSWRPTQEEPQSMPDGSSGDWRSQLQPEARQRIVNKIMETLKRHLPISAPEGLNELQKIAFRYEDKIYTAAANQSQHAERPGQINPSINQNPADPATLDSIAPTGHATVADLQEGIYQKVSNIFFICGRLSPWKIFYLADLND